MLGKEHCTGAVTLHCSAVSLPTYLLKLNWIVTFGKNEHYVLYFKFSVSGVATHHSTTYKVNTVAGNQSIEVDPIQFRTVFHKFSMDECHAGVVKVMEDALSTIMYVIVLSSPCLGIWAALLIDSIILP